MKMQMPVTEEKNEYFTFLKYGILSTVRQGKEYGPQWKDIIY